MKRRPDGLIGKFYSKESQQELVFQLIKEDGTYYIKRGSSTLFTFHEEEKALKGFRALYSKWSVHVEEK